jgi:hypothetical protein
MRRYHLPPMMEINKIMESMHEDGALEIVQDGALRFDVALTEKDCEFLKHCGIAVQG